jgi:endonuclease YncB( thermonuclease family)
MKKLSIVFIFVTMSLGLFACTQTPEETGPIDISYQWSEATTLQAVEYENREFFRDGIGIVELDRCVDGDTSTFTSGTGRPFTVRYIGIDTAESTTRVEPWGMPATLYVCEILEAAEIIILERDLAVGNRDNFGRELAYVWVDGILLNLRLVEEAFTPAQGTGILKYGDAFLAAQAHAMRTGRRIWGETDPGFNAEIIELTVEELLVNKEMYVNRFLNVTGKVTRIGGGNFHMGTAVGEDILVYARNQIPATISEFFDPGSTIKLNNVFLTRFGGQWQLTNFIVRDVEFLD